MNSPGPSRISCDATRHWPDNSPTRPSPLTRSTPARSTAVRLMGAGALAELAVLVALTQITQDLSA